MGISRVSIPLDRSVVKIVDRLVAKGRFRTRGQAIRSAITEKLQGRVNPLTVAEALTIVRKGRIEHRRGRTRRITSLADLL